MALAPQFEEGWKSHDERLNPPLRRRQPPPRRTTGRNDALGKVDHTGGDEQPPQHPARRQPDRGRGPPVGIAAGGQDGQEHDAAVEQYEPAPPGAPKARP